SHPDHAIAKKQMKGYGGMLSFELKEDIDVSQFLDALQIIKPAMSLAGVESTILSPAQTSHSLLTAEEREAQGISDRILRFSVGIEDRKDRKSTRLNSSHVKISYAVFCLKKK